MFWKLPLPFLLASTLQQRQTTTTTTTTDPVEALRSVYTSLERPSELHCNVTDTIRFNFVPDPSSATASSFTTQTKDAATAIANKPTAVYLPGLDGYGISGIQQFHDLATHFDLWRMHIAPHDRSSLSQVVDAIQTFLQDETAQDVVLIGESTGGFLAVATALKQPQSLKGLVLVNPATSFDQTAWQDLVPLLTALPNNNDMERKERSNSPSPYAILGSLILSAIVPDRQQMGQIVQALDIQPSLESLTQLTSDMVASMHNCEERLPADMLKHRVEEWLGVGVPLINRRLDRINIPTLIVAGENDQLLPSKDEAKRLKALWPHAEILNVPNRGHLVLDDTVNLTEAILYSNIFERKPYNRITDWKLPSNTDEYIASNVQPLRNIFSPVYFSTDQNRKRWMGMSKIPKTDKPIVFVANHQFMGLDLQLIGADLLEERGILARGLAHPTLFTMPRNLNFGDLDGRTPGIAETSNAFNLMSGGGFERFGAVPVTPFNYYKLLQAGQSALLFPGGAEEALSGNKSYPLFWPEKVDFVRTAARFNATIVPLSAVGMVDSVDVLVEPKEILNLPIIGERIREVGSSMSSARYDRKNGEDAIGLPIAAPRIPRRNYFLFGKPIDTSALDPNDKETCARVYNEAREEVRRGIDDLLRVRRNDPYAGLAQRLLYERIYRKKAPTVPVAKLN